MTPSRRAAWRPVRSSVTYDTQEATATGIYGIIVGAAVLAASHASSAWATDVAVLVTLAIYWVAERYARIVAARIHQGHRPPWHAVREQLTTGWEMITVSFLPLVVLAVARMLGASLQGAIVWALICSTVQLCAAGWQAGRGGRLTVPERLVSAAVAGVFGVGMITIKAFLH